MAEGAPVKEMLELVIPPTTGWVAQWQSVPRVNGVVPGSIPGLAFSFSSYRKGPVDSWYHLPWAYPPAS